MPGAVGSTWKRLREITYFFCGIEDKCAHVGVYASRPARIRQGGTMWEAMNDMRIGDLNISNDYVPADSPSAGYDTGGPTSIGKIFMIIYVLGAIRSSDNNMRAFHHLQILHDEEVENQLHHLIPQMESWLLGAIPFSGNQTELGVAFPVAENVDAALAPIRKLIYKGSRVCTSSHRTDHKHTNELVPRSLYRPPRRRQTANRRHTSESRKVDLDRSACCC
ncbi:hypothetical protein TSTA_108430 [Talaromyces stipitatus ATCC 10500]|uniref:Uncharacterized protein n=1 Tax=Talaromyces stipitatus (strain ATCC 10500 / CBS 375.48 / QM 6759 / NRRL 1006) TaxID=441959 RepID=B8MUI9_TALSN|nr:uncharacterized protein TSTA_108430 [Talaromyces stipitatus ATCC 10500]EED11656.1 hypothetical protein TSTA_108430 [Talaromyces stipitatus ATCC 10500]